MFTRRPRALMLRYRCEHCRARLVAPAEHARSAVTCDACGGVTRPVHRIDRRQLAQLSAWEQAIDVARSRPIVPETHPALDLPMAPLAPLGALFAGVAAVAVAVSMTHGLGRVACVALFIAALVAGWRWIRSCFAAIGERLDQVEAVRLHYGTVHLVRMLLAWLRSQPLRRKPLAGGLILAWAAVYSPYLLSATLFFWPRSRALTLRV